ncbi:MAG: signal peptidase I [Acidimicrobiales bacterium]
MSVGPYVETLEQPRGAEPVDGPSDGGDPPDPLAELEESSVRRRRRARVWILLLFGVVVLVFIVQATTLQTFTVSSDSTSMEPTLQPGDRIIAVKVGYTLHEGDIVILKRPPLAFNDTNNEDLVKRIVGMPGDYLSSRGNTIFVNGKPLHASWMYRGEALGREIGTYVYVPKGEYYLLGDNLNGSYDSRYWGPVPRSYIIAKVECVVWRGGPDLHCF